MDVPTTATLRPSRAAAGGWTLVGLAATALATWVAVDARASLVAWVFAALCLVVTSYVGLQLVLPARFTVHLGSSDVEVRLPWQNRRVPWDRIHRARVIRVAGEPVLELHVWDHEDQQQPSGMGILLPVGADQAVLHRVLAERLGRARPDPDEPTRTTD